MRKFLCLWGMLLLLSVTARAADAPKADVYLGFSVVRALLGQVPPNNLSGGSFNVYGGGGSISFNVTRMLGIVGDFGGYQVDDAKGGSGTLYSYLFGPRISYRGHPRFRPYVHALLGGASATSGYLRAPVSQQSFAWTLGGGVDVKLFHGIAWRFGQAEIFRTTFREGTATKKEGRNNIRISTGVVFSFGK